MRLLLLLLMLAASGLAPASAQPAALATAERDRIVALQQRVIDLGRKQADKIRADEALLDNARRDAQSQYALILMTVGQCDQAVAFVQDRTEIRASGVDRLMIRAELNRDRPCAVRLARLMEQRSDDPDLTTDGQTISRFVATAYLDAAGDESAPTRLAAIESDLLKLADRDAVWRARWRALGAYLPTKRAMESLDRLADRMVAEKYDPTSPTGKGQLAFFAHMNRCDLVEKVLRQGPTSCQESRQLAEMMYSNNRAPDNLAYMVKTFDDMYPPPTEQSLGEALAARDPWLRITKLLLLVKSCQKALGSTSR